MAARNNKTKLDDNWRERIKVSMLINRLMSHALGECDMQGTQIKAAEILLRKRVPDLAATQHSGDENQPIRHVIEWAK